MFPLYPKMQSLRDTPEMLAQARVVACEKLHGTNFRVLLPAGHSTTAELLAAIRFGSRNLVLPLTDNAEGGLPGALTFFGGSPVRYMLDRLLLLTTLRVLADEAGIVGDLVLFGEMVGQHIQHGVTYTNPQETQFVAFDLAEIVVEQTHKMDYPTRTYTRFLDFHQARGMVVAAGLEWAPVVYEGAPDVAALNGLLERPSTYAWARGLTVPGQVAEGVVIRPEVEARNSRGDRLIAKHKARGFLEQASQKARHAGPITDGQAACQSFAESHVTPGRVVNAMGRVAEARGDADFHPRDTPQVIEAVWADLMGDIDAYPSQLRDDWREMVSHKVRQEDVKRSCGRLAATLFKAELARMAVPYEHRADLMANQPGSAPKGYGPGSYDKPRPTLREAQHGAISSLGRARPVMTVPDLPEPFYTSV